MMAWYEVAFDELYPVLYPHRDRKEAARVTESYADVFADAGVILDVACGSGRYLGALRDAGVPAFGIDLSEFLLNEAVARGGHGGAVLRADIRALPIANATVDLAINMFTSFGYFETDVDNARVLGEVARVLAPGGRLLLDFVNADHVAAHLEPETVRSAGGFEIRERRSIQEGGRRLVKDVRATHPERDAVSYSERVRLYRSDEIAALIEGAGLRVEESAGDYDRNPFIREASPRFIVLAHRPQEES